MNSVCNFFQNELVNREVRGCSSEPGTAGMTPSPPRSGGEGRGEAARYFFYEPLSPALSPLRGERVTGTGVQESDELK